MVRKISWRDLPVLPSYQKKIVYLNNNLWLVDSPGLISSALLSIALPSSGFCTSVQSIPQDSYPYLISQIHHAPGSISAWMIFLGPIDIDTSFDFGEIISHLIVQAGERGVWQILAEVGNDSSEEEILCQAGFRAYAAQQIWTMPQLISSEANRNSWVPKTKNDQHQLDTFYQRIIPGAVQRIEPPPSSSRVEGLLCYQGGNLTGYAETRFGPRGILIDLSLAPEIEDLESTLAGLFLILPYQQSRNVYIRLRSYQERIAFALEGLGAHPGPEQKAVVKRLAVHYNAKQTFTYKAFEKQPDITTPIANSKIRTNYVKSSHHR
jgi:hypothetical protein